MCFQVIFADFQGWGIHRICGEEDTTHFKEHIFHSQKAIKKHHQWTCVENMLQKSWNHLGMYKNM